MSRQFHTRFWSEVVLAGVSGVLGVLTLFWRDWLEAIFGVDPDHHSGSLEAAIVAVLLAVAVASALLARLEHGRARTPAPARG